LLWSHERVHGEASRTATASISISAPGTARFATWTSLLAGGFGPAGYGIRPAREGEVEQLPGIEREAAGLFASRAADLALPADRPPDTTRSTRSAWLRLRGACGLRSVPTIGP
jgi:hypothetical protein